MSDAPAASLDLHAPVPVPPAQPPPATRNRWRPPWPELAGLALPAAGAVVLSVVLSARHAGGLDGAVPALVASLALFAICGDGLAVALLPPAWRAVAPVFALVLGAASSGILLTVLGFLHVPLRISVWVTVAAGLVASAVLRRREREARAAAAPRGRLGWGRAASWLAALAVVLCVGLIPSLMTRTDTIYGNNPDAHQVVGIAVLLQHVPPAGTDNALPIDTVPPAWRFRYSIFYPLAAVSNVSRQDPIRAFPAMAALLMALAALGFAAVAVECFGAPAAAGPGIAVAAGLAWVPMHLAWHPYWNQLWGLALLPYALMFGWRAARSRDRRAAGLLALLIVALGLAYPLAAPYPLVIVAAVAAASGVRLRRPRLGGRRGCLTGGLAFLILGPALAGAAVKLGQGVSQLLSPHSSLWGGDVTHLTRVGNFAGTGGGVLPALAVLLVAAIGLRALPRRIAVAVGLALAVLLALDLRFRLTSGGAYMDFKHLSYVGMIVLALAAAAVTRWIASGSPPAVAAGLLVAGIWLGGALWHDRTEARATGEQVTTQLLDIRAWAQRLPHGASVRVDLPPSGEQLWAVYMLGSHPVDSPTPLGGTTYAHARNGLRADYSLSWRHSPSLDPLLRRPLPPVGFARNPPLFADDQYVLRRIVWPRTGPYARYPDTSSTALVEP